MQKKYPDLKWREVWNVLYLFEAKKLNTRQSREALMALGIEAQDAIMVINDTALNGYSPHRYVIDWDRYP